MYSWYTNYETVVLSQVRCFSSRRGLFELDIARYGWLYSPLEASMCKLEVDSSQHANVDQRLLISWMYCRIIFYHKYLQDVRTATF